MCSNRFTSAWACYLSSKDNTEHYWGYYSYYCWYYHSSYWRSWLWLQGKFFVKWDASTRWKMHSTLGFFSKIFLSIQTLLLELCIWCSFSSITVFILAHSSKNGIRKSIRKSYTVVQCKTTPNSSIELVTSMLVTDVGEQMSWWQVRDVGDRFNTLSKSPT